MLLNVACYKIRDVFENWAQLVPNTIRMQKCVTFFGLQRSFNEISKTAIGLESFLFLIIER